MRSTCAGALAGRSDRKATNRSVQKEQRQQTLEDVDVDEDEDDGGSRCKGWTHQIEEDGDDDDDDEEEVKCCLLFLRGGWSERS
jgi:hypothetical protein